MNVIIGETGHKKGQARDCMGSRFASVGSEKRRPSNWSLSTRPSFETHGLYAHEWPKLPLSPHRLDQYRVHQSATRHRYPRQSGSLIYSIVLAQWPHLFFFVAVESFSFRVIVQLGKFIGFGWQRTVCQIRFVRRPITRGFKHQQVFVDARRRHLGIGYWTATHAISQQQTNDAHARLAGRQRQNAPFCYSFDCRLQPRRDHYLTNVIKTEKWPLESPLFIYLIFSPFPQIRVKSQSRHECSPKEHRLQRDSQTESGNIFFLTSKQIIEKQSNWVFTMFCLDHKQTSTRREWRQWFHLNKSAQK